MLITIFVLTTLLFSFSLKNKITSLGFHIQPYFLTDGKQVDYKLYVLNEEGHYASTERNPDISQYIASDASNGFDYRGELDAWTEIAGGLISEGDLLKDSTTSNITEADYFQIPCGRFKKISIPSGGLRSFYIGMPKSGLITARLEEGETLNNEMSLMGNGDVNAPKILVGEGTLSYPMSEESFDYTPKSFVGQVYYEEECLSSAPSISGTYFEVFMLMILYRARICPTPLKAHTLFS